MTLHRSPSPHGSSLQSIVQHAGGVLAARDGHFVATNFGSAAGELAACVRAVGLTDRSELIKLSLTGRPGALAALVAELAGAEPAPGGAVLAGGAWWCVQSPESVIVIAEPRPGRRLRDGLGLRLLRHSGVSLTDHSDDWAALAVVGSRASQVLAALGVYGAPGDPRQVSPLTSHGVGAADVTWLLESDHKALAVMDAADAPAVWRAIDSAGAPFGICAVGQDAVARYALIREAARAAL